MGWRDVRQPAPRTPPVPTGLFQIPSFPRPIHLSTCGLWGGEQQRAGSQTRAQRERRGKLTRPGSSAATARPRASRAGWAASRCGHAPPHGRAREAGDEPGGQFPPNACPSVARSTPTWRGLLTKPWGPPLSRRQASLVGRDSRDTGSSPGSASNELASLGKSSPLSKPLPSLQHGRID